MKFPKPWYRKSRGGWFVTFNGQQIKLGKTKPEALRRYQELMAKPKRRSVASDSVLAIIDAFLDWCEKNRAPDTYEWYRFRLERFARRYPDLRTAELRPYHVQQWLDTFNLSNGSKRNYGRAVKRCLRWAKRQGYIDENPIADLDMPSAGKREVVVPDADFESLLNRILDPCFSDLVVVTWETGCRPQESLRVEARHVDVGNRRWVFPQPESKTDIPRVVYLTDRALEITMRLVSRYPVGPLFRNSKRRPWTPYAVNCAFCRLQLRFGKAEMKRRSIAVPEKGIQRLIP